MIEEYFAELKYIFEQNADPVIAAGAKSYMRNKSEFYGLASPLRRKLVKEFAAGNGYPAYEQTEEMIHFAWEQPQREWQYIAMELAARNLKYADISLLGLAEWMITNKSWWDTVDFVAPNIAGMLFKKFPDIKMQHIESWIESENLWLQRSCLIHQLRYNNTTDSALLFNLCERLSGHPDFFIRKAIGWSLRQYSKMNPDGVIDFVNSHDLSTLSRKEALKIVNKKIPELSD